MTTDRPRFLGNWVLRREREKELMQPLYTKEISDAAGRISESYSSRNLTRAEAGALAVHSVLRDRIWKVSNQYGPDDHSLEYRAKLSWAGQQLQHVEANKNYKSAQIKINRSNSN